MQNILIDHQMTQQIKDKLIFENEYQKEIINFEINSIFSFEYKKYLVLKAFKQLHFKDFDNDLKIMVLQVFTEEV